MGVGVGVGEGEVVVVVVVELVTKRGLVPVPLTQARAGVQLLGEMLLPSALQEVFAASTMSRRRSFNPVCTDTVP